MQITTLDLFCFVFSIIMPEIWLNYGITDIVLDIKAENLSKNWFWW